MMKLVFYTRRSWEYVNKQGIGCNTLSSDDSANFLSFLQELRSDDTGANLILSAAVGLTPFNGPDGTPLADVSQFASVLDHIGLLSFTVLVRRLIYGLAIMAYDIWGSWSNGVGPNAPLNDSCAPSDKQAGSAASAVSAWTEAGFPAEQVRPVQYGVHRLIVY
jgi:chitinase